MSSFIPQPKAKLPAHVLAFARIVEAKTIQEAKNIIQNVVNSKQTKPKSKSKPKPHLS